MRPIMENHPLGWPKTPRTPTSTTLFSKIFGLSNQQIFVLSFYLIDFDKNVKFDQCRLSSVVVVVVKWMSKWMVVWNNLWNLGSGGSAWCLWTPDTFTRWQLSCSWKANPLPRKIVFSWACLFLLPPRRHAKNYLCVYDIWAALSTNRSA